MGAAIAAALIAAGGSAYAANQSGKAAKSSAPNTKKAISDLRSIDLGDVPDAAPYAPLNLSAEQIDSILANMGALPNMQSLVALTNRGITNDSISRAKKMIPGYMDSMRRMGENTNAMLSGRLPFEDVMDITGDRNSMTGSIGIPGTGGAATLKDLGISRMDAMKSGTGMLGDMISMAETISPSASYMRPQSMMISPMDRIAAQTEQNSLDQQSRQNANNLRAQADPTDLAIAQLLTGQSMLGNVGGGGRGIDASTIASMTGAAGQLVGGVSDWGNRRGYWGTPKQTSGGGYYSERSMWKAAPYASGSSYVDGAGYIPTAKTTGRIWNGSEFNAV